MLNLPNITAIAVTSIEEDLTMAALLYSAEKINFGKIKLITTFEPSIKSDKVEINKLNYKLSFAGYNNFMGRELYKYIDTEYALLIQYDGFVVNPHNWKDDFLNYDYIGAAWNTSHVGHRVGNGGLCLRSKKFLDLCKYIPTHHANEDIFYSCVYRYYFIQNGCKFPDVLTAYSFSVEQTIPEKEYTFENSFGFHGKEHLGEEHKKYLSILNKYCENLKQK